MSNPYTEGYFERGEGSNYHNYADDPGWRVTANVLNRFMPADGGEDIGERWLMEIAAAKGYFLRAAREVGYDTYGVDISEYATETAVHEVECLDITTPQDAWPLSVASNKGLMNVVCSWEFLEHIEGDKIEDVLTNMAVFGESDQWASGVSLFVHRIGTTTVEGVRQDNDITHVSNHTREKWLEIIDEWAAKQDDFKLKRATEVEDALDAAFAGRDWAGRFFAYWMDKNMEDK